MKLSDNDIFVCLNCNTKYDITKINKCPNCESMYIGGLENTLGYQLNRLYQAFEEFKKEIKKELEKIYEAIKN